MKDIVQRLLNSAILADRVGDHSLAKVLTDAIKEIENARKGYIRDSVDKGAESGRSEELSGLRKD